MWNNIKKRIQNRKGMGSLEITICSFIVLLMVAGLVDMIQITQRLDTASQVTGYVSRVVQKQGGVQTLRIPNFNGKYTTTKVLYNNVKDMMSANGIKEKDWTLKLTAGGVTRTIKSNTNFPIINYGYRITVTLDTNYRWDVLSSMIPDRLMATKESKREVLSGYQVRNSTGIQTDMNVK